MKTTSTILPDFINDFNMKVYETGVCFEAIINFNLPFRSFNMESEVHMDSMLSGDFDTVYLLNPDITTYKMPTSFNIVNHQFIYPKYKGLIIGGNNASLGRFTVSIFPISEHCSEKTLIEIRAKKLN